MFRHRIRVRYAECDAQGVVFNANYLMYFDVAMTEFQREVLAGYTALLEAGIDMVVAEARLRYHAPAAFDEEIDIEVAPQRLGTTSVTLAFAVTRAGARLVDGELRYVFVDAAAKSKRPMPDDVRAALELRVTS